jgi:ParB-like chromosome segregation protein Spo0J
LPTKNATAKAMNEAGIPFTLATAPPSRIHPNPWNPNRMDAATLRAERESVAAFGFVDPLTVREHPTRKATKAGPHYQLIDGEHRLKIGVEAGLPQLPLVVCDLDDIAARKLTVILNETRGSADPLRLSALLRDLRSELGDRLGDALRYSRDELDRLISFTAPDWRDAFADYDLDAPPEKAPASTFLLSCRLPLDFRPVIADAAELVGEEDKPADLTAVTAAAIRAYAEAKL